MGGGDSHASGVGKRSGISEWRDAQCLEGQPDTLRKGTGNIGLFIIKSVKKIECLKFRPWLGTRWGQWELQRKVFPKPQERKNEAGSRKWDTGPFQTREIQI